VYGDKIAPRPRRQWNDGVGAEDEGAVERSGCHSPDPPPNVEASTRRWKPLGPDDNRTGPHFATVAEERRSARVDVDPERTANLPQPTQRAAPNPSGPIVRTDGQANVKPFLSGDHAALEHEDELAGAEHRVCRESSDDGGIP
jgi:hypothetical protein